MASSNPTSDVAPPLSKFEFRADDGAWYNVEFELHGDRLTVKYCFFSSDYDQVFKADQFTTFEDVDSFSNRFRPSSQQLQDEDCRKAVPCMMVIAAHRLGDDDVRFYDAIIEEVERQDHTFDNGIEICCCNFILHWLHGPNAGYLTCARAADICFLQLNPETDPDVDAFLERLMEIIENSGSEAVACVNGTHILNPEVSPLYEHGLKETQARYLQQCGSSEGMISNLREMLEDKILVGSSFTHNTEAIGDHENAASNNMEEILGQHFIVIENLEEDLSSLMIMGFIYEKINIVPKAYIYQSLLLQSYTWGVVVVNDEKELEKLRDFLCDPNHIIASSRGRPWVVTDKVPISQTPTRSLLPNENDENIVSGNALEVVHSNSNGYVRAKQLRDSFIDLKNHQLKQKKHLAMEEGQNSEVQ